MLILNPNCRLPEACAIAIGLQIADSVFTKHGVACVVTSVMDSKHGDGTLHGKGLAFDLRIKHLDGNIADISGKDISLATAMCAELRAAMDYQFDIVLESDHIHVEYDPK